MTDHSLDEKTVAGINPVHSLLVNKPERVNHVMLSRQSGNKKLYQIQKIAHEKKIRTHQLPQERLNRLFKGNHQGVIAFCNHRALDNWPTVKDALITLVQTGGHPLLGLAAAMEDPRNFGACIRSAAGFGLQAFCYPGKGSCGLTPSAAKASSGASELLPICRLGHVSAELSDLKSAGFKVIGLESESHSPLHKLSLKGPMVLVIGGEDRGIPPHIRRHCDNLVNIPISASAHSYNASVAFALLLYEINRQINFGKKLICGLNS